MHAPGADFLQQDLNHAITHSTNYSSPSITPPPPPPPRPFTITPPTPLPSLVVCLLSWVELQRSCL
jgi:hypothetical protein